MSKRRSDIRKINTEFRETYVVDLYENDVLVESRELPGKSIYYANDVAENWENHIIQPATQ